MTAATKTTKLTKLPAPDACAHPTKTPALAQEWAVWRQLRDCLEHRAQFVYNYL